MPLSELQQKLIRLALDRAAQPGEIANAAVKLIESWRAQGKTLEDLFGDNALAVQEAAQQYWAPDYGLCKMRFGKHRDKEFKDIPPSYFRWLLPELKKKGPDEPYYENNQRLIEEIENFLKQY
jgi:hypothetical protein